MSAEIVDQRVATTDQFITLKAYAFGKLK